MRNFLYLAVILFTTLQLKAQKKVDSSVVEEEAINAYADSLRGAMKYKTGLVTLSAGDAQLNVPAGFKFLGKEQSQFIIEKIYGNPPQIAAEALGMIFPEKSDILTENSYVFIVKYEDVGFIKDDDAEHMNYDDLKKQIIEDEVKTNEERKKNGYRTIHLIDWAQKPFYDKEHKVLHWAKELQVGEQPSDNNTLNYEVRILGKKGILSLDAVCSMSELPLVKADIDKVLKMATFTEGNAYADFDPKVDKVAAWTIGGLIAGKVLAKVGFFAVILKYLAVIWKFLVVAAMAVIGFIRKKILGKKDEPSYQITTTEVPDTVSEEIAQDTPPQHPSSEEHKDTPPMV
ncbi:DUF2167 domain-containing protein [Chitinophaga sp. Cy-1792]|uniref:DUF2167 domain-containing protein n=1 Tax=Chitinophaga sp. Cy-1792 TaxID=2608339 RepID=UPI00141F8B8B|nr:DUF2167 domain-containing protein [Chitinophaga sp. Cy-1792]NIG53097.1 DUF2167 domain-containing protein [Chitinophaga sp. Cy-1792]